MKKALSIILVLALACSLFGGAALAATSDYALTGGSVTVDGTADQTVTVAFISVPGVNCYNFSGNWSLKETEESSYLTLSALSSNYPAGTSLKENRISSGRTWWCDDLFETPLVVEENGTIWAATYTVNKNTPTGRYTVSLEVDGFYKGYSPDPDAIETWTATITVKNTSDPDPTPDPTPDPAANGYTVTVKADKAAVATGETVLISLDVANSVSTVTKFYVIDMVLTYDSANFTYDNSNSILPTGLTADASNGTLTIQRYGNAIELQDGAEFKLAFKAGNSAAENCEFKVTKAKIDIADNADQNAPDASVSGTPKVTVSQKYTVTFVGGTGATGTAPTQDPVTAGTQIRLPANTFTKDGYTFAGWKSSADQEVYKAGDSYTMTAANTTFTAQWSQNYTVTFVGGSGATGTAPTQDPVPVGATITLPANTFTNGDYTFAGWKCSADQEVYNAGVFYTMTAENTTFTAQWTETATATASIVSGYLDGYTLIKVTVTGDSDQTPTYDNKTMFKLSGTGYEADAYYYIVEGTVTASTAQGKLGWSDSAATTLTKDGDANQTGRVDINDAQFIYNLYNGVSVTYNMSVEQLLASDANGDGKVNVQDCTAAIDKIQ